MVCLKLKQMLFRAKLGNRESTDWPTGRADRERESTIDVNQLLNFEFILVEKERLLKKKLGRGEKILPSRSPPPYCLNLHFPNLKAETGLYKAKPAFSGFCNAAHLEEQGKDMLKVYEILSCSTLKYHKENLQIHCNLESRKNHII